MEITKNRQSEEVLRKMALRAFPGKQMEAEVIAMQIVHKTGTVKAAKVLYYDTSNEICDSHYFQDLFSFVYQLISNVLSDAKRKQVDIVVSAEKILEMLKRDRAVFEQVT